MTRSKKIFTGFAIAFALFLALVIYDFSSRTEFPHAKRDPVKKQQEGAAQQDTVRKEAE